MTKQETREQLSKELRTNNLSNLLTKLNLNELAVNVYIDGQLIDEDEWTNSDRYAIVDEPGSIRLSSRYPQTLDVDCWKY